MTDSRFKTVYFPSEAIAKAFGAIHCADFPDWRVVEYGRGHAVQTRKSGDYLAANGKPTMHNRMTEFFK